ncbi:MAG: hypothetical protein R2771_05465 [Saprospiraceae bacterium]
MTIITISHGDHVHTPDGRIVEVGKNILQFNDVGAARNRGYFEAKEILAINMVSSPGSGKTTFLEKTLSDISKDLNFYIGRRSADYNDA